MVQEEVAQKLVAKRGRSYSATTLFLQHHLQFELMEKIPPSAFVPPPKVHSRLVYFKPILQPAAIAHEGDFWKFVKLCFAHPRRTLRNNLKPTHYDLSLLSETWLGKRAQELSFDEFLGMWRLIAPAQ